MSAKFASSVRRKFWTSLALVGASGGVVSGSVRAAPTPFPGTDTLLWLASSEEGEGGEAATAAAPAPESGEGGEGGEGGAPDGASPEAAYLIELGKLEAHPSTTLHRVTPVTRGERLAVVGWARCRVRTAERREVLFDLARAVADVHGKEGKSALFDTLTKTRSNLIRMWAGD